MRADLPVVPEGLTAELLEALKELMADDGVVNCGIANAGPLAQRSFIKAARAAKDAIAKATGAQ